MTVTEELRRGLDERGVEWSATVGANGTIWTHWDAFNGQRIHAMDNEDGTVEIFDQWNLTPAQAIAATLGSCNCSNNCTNSERTGTCHDKGTFNSWGFFTCSNCKVVVPVEAVREAPSIGKVVPISFCPNCGRRIVDPTTNDVDAEVDDG